MYSSTMCQMVNIPMCREGGEREREREREEEEVFYFPKLKEQ